MIAVDSPAWRGLAQALGAALLFGVTAPLAKHYLTGIPALQAAGLLYTSAGLVLALAVGALGGVAIMITESHDHEHTHVALTHAHAHQPDHHHRHPHMYPCVTSNIML